jgi:hypothetical protein
LAFAVPASPPAAALSRWTGSIDLYRTGVFSTQQTWLWCTAADVQIVRNIADRQRDHSRASQDRYFSYMRAHDRYRIPVKDGVDPAGWTAGLHHFVDSRYRLVVSSSFDSALRSAVTNLRKTNLPVGITVAHGNHAWVLTGFTATADPARTTRFTVTSVRVTGPLWGVQSRSYGYDMTPNTRLTPRQLAGFFTPWHYAGVRMSWEGRWVSIQAVPVTARTAGPTPRPVVSTAPTTAGPTASAATSSSPAVSAAASPELLAPAPGRAEAEPTARTPPSPAADIAFGQGSMAADQVAIPSDFVLIATVAALFAVVASWRHRRSGRRQ